MNKSIFTIIFSLAILGIVFVLLFSKKEKAKEISFADFYCKYASEIQSRAAKTLENTYGVKCCGSTRGMPYFINELGLYFYVRKFGSVEQTRELIVNMAELYISQIHDYKKAKPYLVSFPFPVTNIQVSLSFVDKNGNEHPNQPVNYVTLGSGKIFYNFIDYKTHNNKIVLKESYDDAYKIVMGHPRPEALNPGPRKQEPELNRDGSIAIPAVLNNDPNNPWPEKPS